MITQLMLLFTQQVTLCGLGDVPLDSCIDAAMAACANDKSRCDVQIAAGDYDIQRTIEICPGVRLLGAGSRDSAAKPTRINTKKPITAIHIKTRTQCRSEGLPWVGRASIEGLGLRDLDRTAETQTSSGIFYGIFAESAPAIKDVNIIGYVIGIRITGGSTIQMRVKAK